MVFKKNDIVVHKEKGFLKIVQSIGSGNNLKYSVINRYNIDYVVNPKDIVMFDPIFQDYFLSRKFLDKFDYTTYMRGLKYYEEDRVYAIDYAAFPFSITSEVKGSGRKIYRTTIRFNRNRMVDSDCSCPMGYHCKHVVALLISLSHEINDVMKAESKEDLINKAVEKYEKLPPLDRINTIFSENNEYYLVDYILDDLSKYAKEYEEAYGKLLMAYSIKYQRQAYLNRDKIIKVVNSLSDNDILKRYIGCFLDGVKRSYYYYNYLAFKEKAVSVDGFPNLKYFDIKYSLVRKKDIIFLYVTLFSKDDSVIKFREDEDDYIHIDDTYFDRDYSEYLSSLCVKYVKTFYHDEIEKLNENIKKEIEEEERKRKLLKLSDDMSILVDTLDKKRTYLRNDKKAKISFEFDAYHYEEYYKYYDGYGVHLKIGVDRMYVVKNIKEFTLRFKDEETYSYGKGLEFTHSINNVRDEDKEALDTIILLASGYNSQELLDNRKALPLNNKNFETLITRLKGNTVTIFDKVYDVTLNRIIFKVYVDKNYEIKIRTSLSDYQVISLGGSLLVLNNDNKTVDFVACTKDEAKLISFAVKNENVSIKGVLQKFKDEIYSRFYNSIELSESIEDEFKLSELRIDSYFDYVKGMITVRNSFLKNDKEINPDTMKNHVDINRRDNYLNYLSNLGFMESQMEKDSDILNFFSMDMNELKRYANIYLSESIMNKSVQNFRMQTIRIQYDSTVVKAFLEDSKYDDEELKTILKAIRHKKKFVLLSGDRIINLDNKEAKEFESAVTDLELDPDALSKEKELSMSKALRAFAHDSGCVIDDYLYSMVDEIKNFKTKDIPLPKLNATLREYQVEGYKWMSILSKYHVGGILADDMGLGKTLEVISLLTSDNTPMPSLVVCPKSVVFNWVNEFKRFSPSEKVIEIYGNSEVRKEKIKSIKNVGKICLVTSYDSLRNDLEYYDFPLNYMVLDEAQYIKNVNAKKSRSVKALDAMHKFALTGTPIENNVIDLWSIFDYIMPGYLDNLTDFKHDYNGDERYTTVISRRIAPFILRRTKKEVLKDLPDKYERVLVAEMTDKQRKLYEAYRMEAKEAMNIGGKSFDILPYLTKLRQVCDAPEMFIDGYNGESGKLELLKELIDEYLENGHRILIFSQFVKALNLIEKILKDKGISYYMITGDTKSEDRIRYMEEFNGTNERNIFLISLKAGGTGLNLVGADTVIHFDPWWNTSIEDQASDRAHRIGQTKNVEVIKLISEDSIEQRVIELQNLKKDLIDKLISNDDKSVTGISMEDIKFILEREEED